MIHTSTTNGTHYNNNAFFYNPVPYDDIKYQSHGPLFYDYIKPFSSSSSSSSSNNADGNSNLIAISSLPSSIEHHVSKYDTLAGVAIRYGVEVADIKKLNNLTTDLQMFALKTLLIPLPGRHPPSPCLSTSGPSSSEHSPSRLIDSAIFESFQSLKITPERNVTHAMNSLQGYYALDEQRNHSEGFEMAPYNRGTTSNNENEGVFSSPMDPSSMNPPLSQHRKSRSVANGFKSDEDDLVNDMDAAAEWIESLNKRRQKSEADFPRTPEKLLKEENGSGSWFSSITGKGLALRSKASSRTNLVSEVEANGTNGLPFSFGDSNGDESSSGVRKSSSTSSLQDQQDSNNNSSSLWSAAKWSLKPDLQAALTKPIFDGLPKPIIGRISKAALD